MGEQYSTFLRITFLIHVIIGAIFGICLYIIPQIFLPLLGMTFLDPATRILGAIMLALSIGSVLALATKEWTRVRIIVEVEIFWCILGLIGAIVHLFMAPQLSLLAGTIIVAILAILLFLFLISYFIEVRD